MAQKVGLPNIIGSHRDKIFRQRLEKIAGRGRHTIDTVDTITLTGSTGGLETTLYSKSFSSEFFQSIGDGLYFTASGSLLNVAATDEVKAAYYDHTGGFVQNIAITPTVVTVGGSFAFNMEGWMKVAEQGKMGSFGKAFTSDVAPNSRLQSFAATSFPFFRNRQSIEFRLSTILNDTVNLHFLTLEFVPGVIS